MAKNGKLTARQQRAIAALLSARDTRAAATAAKVGYRTLCRWLSEDPAFLEALRSAETEAISTAARLLAGEYGAAVETLAAIHRDSSQPAAVRVSAARALIEQLIKLREHAVLEERVEKLEKIQIVEVHIPDDGKLEQAA